MPLHCPPLDDAIAVDLRRHSDAGPDPEAWLRYQRVWLAAAGQGVAHIAQVALRSPANGSRVMLPAGSVCKRATWTLTRGTTAQPDYIGNAGERRHCQRARSHRLPLCST